MLASVTLALGRYLRGNGHDTEGLVLKAMVPVSVRTKAQRGALGNQVAAMWAPLPVGVENPAECLREIAAAMEDLKNVRPGRRRPGADQPRRLRAADDPQPGRAPAGAPAVLQPRRHERPRTAVPAVPARAPAAKLYPVVPLAQRQALGIAVMSYDGHLGFGLLGDYDALPDLEAIALDLKWAIASLVRAAGVRPRPARSGDGRASAKPPSRAATRRRGTKNPGSCR